MENSTEQVAQEDKRPMSLREISKAFRFDRWLADRIVNGDPNSPQPPMDPARREIFQMKSATPTEE